MGICSGEESSYRQEGRLNLWQASRLDCFIIICLYLDIQERIDGLLLFNAQADHLGARPGTQLTTIMPDSFLFAFGSEAYFFFFNTLRMRKQARP